jgi:hypothetical protein
MAEGMVELGAETIGTRILGANAEGMKLVKRQTSEDAARGRNLLEEV